MVIASHTEAKQGPMVPFLGAGEWKGTLLPAGEAFVTGIGAGTTYPDYKPAPFIVSSRHGDVDMVTVVTEGIFSYCGLKLKIDTDRFVGPEQAAVREPGRAGGPCDHGGIRLPDAGAGRACAISPAAARRKAWSPARPC